MSEANRNVVFCNTDKLFIESCRLFICAILRFYNYITTSSSQLKQWQLEYCDPVVIPSLCYTSLSNNYLQMLVYGSHAFRTIHFGVFTKIKQDKKRKHFSSEKKITIVPKGSHCNKEKGATNSLY